MFNEVELSLDEPDGWTDYDENVRLYPFVILYFRLLLLILLHLSQSSQPVGVSEFESKIERA